MYIDKSKVIKVDAIRFIEVIILVICIIIVNIDYSIFPDYETVNGELTNIQAFETKTHPVFLAVYKLDDGTEVQRNESFIFYSKANLHQIYKFDIKKPFTVSKIIYIAAFVISMLYIILYIVVFLLHP